jgi:hypothetical protein
MEAIGKEKGTSLDLRNCEKEEEKEEQRLIGSL